MSETDENEMEAIENRILEQTRSDITILQDIQLNPPKTLTPQERFIELYPDVKQLQVELPTKFSNKYEYHLFRTPKNFDPLPLMNMEINMEEENVIVCGDKKFTLKPTSKVPNEGMIIPGNKILKFKSNIIMEKYVKSKKKCSMKSTERKSVSLPTELKNRHPLFGSDFKNNIDLNKNIREKLDAAISDSLQSSKRPKKKKLKTEDHTQSDEVIFDLLNNLATPTHDSSTKNVSLSKTKTSSTKKRKTKQSIIDETLRDLRSELLSEFEADMSTKSAKKKKHKKDKEASFMDVDITSDIQPMQIFKQETNRLSIVNSTMMDFSKRPKFDANMSVIMTIKEEHTEERNGTFNGVDTKPKKRKKTKVTE